MKRGVEAPSYQVELWPAFQAQIMPEPAPELAELAGPESVKLEAADAEVVIEQKVPEQQKRDASKPQALEQPPQAESERQELREQKQGCIGPEEMERLEQARRSGTDAAGDDPAGGLGIPCVAG
jgi:hypothetical protein